MTKKFEDPIVEEVHRTRERLLAKYGGSEGYAEHLRKLEIDLADRLVIREPRAAKWECSERHQHSAPDL